MPSPLPPPMPEPGPDVPAGANHSRTRRRPFQRRRSRSPLQPRPAVPPAAGSTPAAGSGGAGEPGPPQGWEIADLIATGVLDVVPGDPPVPVSVWRATGPQDPPASPAALYRGLTPQLAARLVTLYTDPGQVVIDCTGDPAIAGAAGAGGRAYRAFDLPDVDLLRHERSGDVGLILLRWPPPSAPTASVEGAGTGPDPQAVLEACAALLCADGHTVVILAPPTGGIYRDYARTIIPAARLAGLGYLQHVVVITLDTDPPPTPPPPARQKRGQKAAGSSAPGGPASRDQGHLDLLVFILRHGTRP